MGIKKTLREILLKDPKNTFNSNQIECDIKLNYALKIMFNLICLFLGQQIFMIIFRDWQNQRNTHRLSIYMIGNYHEEVLRLRSIQLKENLLVFLATAILGLVIIMRYNAKITKIYGRELSETGECEDCI